MICTESWILFILHSQKIPYTPSKSTFIFLPCCVLYNRRNKDITTKDLGWVSVKPQTMTIWWLFSKAIRKLLCTDSRITWRLHSCGQVLSERTLALHFRVEIQFQSTFYNYERFETNKGDKIPDMGCDPLTLNTRSATSASSSLKCLRSERPPFTASSWTARKKLKLSLNTYFKTLSSSFIPLKMTITNQSYFPAVLKHKRDRVIICMLTSSYLSWSTIRQLVFL